MESGPARDACASSRLSRLMSICSADTITSAGWWASIIIISTLAIASVAAARAWAAAS